MSLVIETQFAALTVDENGEISSNIDTSNNNRNLDTAAAGNDIDSVTANKSAFNNMEALGDCLPLPETASPGHEVGSRRIPEWIKSCEFENIPGTPPFRFRMRVDTKMLNLKRAFARVTGLRDTVFLYEGKVVGDLDTPYQLGMGNGFLLEIV